MKNLIKKVVRKMVSDILQEEFFIGVDRCEKHDSTVMICKYSYRSGKFTIISENQYPPKTPLIEFEREIRRLAREYNAKIVRDYPKYAKEFLQDMRI